MWRFIELTFQELAICESKKDTLCSDEGLTLETSAHVFTVFNIPTSTLSWYSSFMFYSLCWCRSTLVLTAGTCIPLLCSLLCCVVFIFSVSNCIVCCFAICVAWFTVLAYGVSNCVVCCLGLLCCVLCCILFLFLCSAQLAISHPRNVESLEKLIKSQTRHSTWCMYCILWHFVDFWLRNSIWIIAKIRKFWWVMFLI